MPYRAGTAFIAVTPSFRGFQTKAAAEAKKLRAVKIPVEYDTRNPVIKPPKPIRVPVNFDGGSFERQLQTKVRAALASLPEAQIGVATTEAEQKLKDLRAELQSLSDKRIGVDLSAEAALAEAHRLQGELARLSAESPNIQVHADTGAAAAELLAVRELANRLDGDKVNVKVDADTGAANAKLTALQRRLSSMGSGAGGRGTLIRVGIALAPAAAAVGGLAGGALGGLSALAAGVVGGGVAAAAVGIGEAKQAVDLNKKLVQATKDRATAMAAVRSASSSLASAVAASDQSQVEGARAVADAEEALGVAREQAARSITSAEQALADAHRAAARAEAQVVQANHAVAQSEKQLHAARRQSVADLAAMAAQVRANILAVQAAAFQAQDANAKLADTEANIFSTSDDIARARLTAAQAESQLGDARRKSADSQKALTYAEKNGTPAVIAAQKAVAAAVLARKQAVQSLADANRQVTRAEVSLGQAQADAARTVADAERNLARARADAATRNAAAARSVADAKRRETEAEKKLTQAERARQKVLASITPAQRKVLAALKELHKAWTGFLLSIDKPMGRMIVGAINVAKAGLKPLAVFLRPVSRALGDVFGMFQRFAKSPAVHQFAKVFGVFSGGLLRDAGKGTINLARGLGNLLRAFMPLGTSMSKGLLGLTRQFRIWSTTVGDSKGFKSFIAWIRQNGPVLLSTLGGLGKAIIAIGIALAPVGVVMIKVIGVIAQWVATFAKAHPQITAMLVLIGGAIAVLIGPITSVLALLAGVAAAVAAGLAPVLLLGAAIVALAVGFGVLYAKSKTFRTIVNTLWADVRRGTEIIWNRVIHPILNAWVWTLEHYLFPALKLLGSLISAQWNHVILPVFKAWSWFMQKVLFPVIRGFWNDVVKPEFTAAGTLIKTVWHQYIQPTFDSLRGGVWAIRDAFHAAVSAIGSIWASLEGLASKPVHFIVDTVYNNGLRKVINALPFVPGTLPPLRVNFAEGGVMPGFSPGRDIHHFVSPTAGHLALSGGEAIMRPEWTKAVGGPKAVARMNASARKGAGFASGGVWRPTTGAYNSGYGIHDVGAMGPNSSAIDFDERVGTPVASVASGRVTRSYDIRGYEPARTLPQDGYRSYGRVIEINHGAFNTLYAHLSKRGVAAGTSVGGGQLIGLSGDTGKVTGAHLHFGAQNISPLAFLNGSTNYSGSAGKGIAASSAGGGGFNPAAALGFLHLDQWKNALNGMGGWGQMLGSMIGGVGGKIASWVKDKVGSFVSSGLGLNGGTVGQIVKGLAQRSGWGSGAEWSALSNIISHESSWNPKAENASGAYGLFQFLPSTWATVGGHKTSDPNLQTQYGLAYIAHKYGDPIKAWDFWQRTDPRPYPGHWYDQGGLAVGRGFLAKNTLEPERVLSPQTTRSFDHLVSHLTYRGAQRLAPLASGDLATVGSAMPTKFDLYDRDGTLIARMAGVASQTVRGQHAFHGAVRRAGMGEDW